jgi:hemerythrin-like domain-containing protein
MPRTSPTSSRAGGKSASRGGAKAAKRRAPAKRAKNDVLAILQDDHKRVQKLFKQFEKADREDTQALRQIAEQACMELQVHARLEEEIFYPALREAIDPDEMEMMDEATVEHDSAKQLMAQLRELQPGDDKYAATFTVLGEYVRHHVEEEEKEIFKHAKRAKLDMQALGEQVQERRAQLTGAMQGGAQARAPGAAGGQEAPREIEVKEMDVEDEADMEPAESAAPPASASRSPRTGRGAR